MSDAVLAKAFAQVNTVKGWRYIDVAGAIINRYAATFPEVSVGIQGLVLKGAPGPMDEVHVTAREVWAGFTKPATTTLVADQSWRFISTVCADLGVTTLSRVGMRLQYVYAAPLDSREIDRITPVLLSAALLGLVGSPSGVEAAIETKIGDGLVATIRVLPARANPDVPAIADLPASGWMIDADIARTADTAIASVRPDLNRAARWASDHLPELARGLFGEQSHG